jgi:hypothetical protein
MDAVLSLPVVVGLLVVLAGLGLVGWLGTWSLRRGRARSVPADDAGGSPAGRGAAAVIAVALERAEGAARLGRHDERRCAF